MSSHSKDELKVLALKERMGKVVSDYEEQLADFRADAPLAVESLKEQIAELQERLDKYETGDEGAGSED